MIYDLCNLYSDENFDTFHHINIIEASQLPKFNHLDSNTNILQIINSLPEEFQAMRIPLMPEKHSVDSKARINNHKKTWQNKIDFPLLPQDEALLQLLESYNNRLVIAFLRKYRSARLYGTSMQPLLFSFEEMNSPTPAGLKGYNIQLEGDTYGSPVYFTPEEIGSNPIIQGLAFPLAGSL